MKKVRTPISWLVLFFGLLWLILWLWQQPASKSQNMDEWPTVAAQDIVTIIIQKAASAKLVLQLEKGQWLLVNGDVAVQDAVLRLRDDLAGMQVIRVVTRKRDYDAELGMLDRAVSVQCMDAQGRLLLDLVIGKQGSDLLSTYVRRVGDDALVAVNRALVWQVKRSNSAWKSVENG
ncbi:MAG: hypothetical protein Q9M20_00350 [Mariprofundaceae bacterium]|nr:hypothetical protein [Mariprofundaceae bacterium]